MDSRNIKILISSIIVSITVIALTFYAFQVVDIDPFEDKAIISIKGTGVLEELNLSMEELKSHKYIQVIDKYFDFINSWGTEYNETYSGVSLWSILLEEKILAAPTEHLTFRFKASDGYIAPRPLNLSLIENEFEVVILAYAKEGSALTSEGPIRSVVDLSILVKGEANSVFAVQKLNTIQIELIE